MKHLTLLFLIAVMLTLNNYSNAIKSSKSLKASKTKVKAFKGNLEKCTVSNLSKDEFSIKAECPIQNSESKKSSWIDLDSCFLNDDGQLSYTPRDPRGANLLKDNCRIFESLVKEVKYYKKKTNGDTVQRTKTFDDSSYINGYCLKNNGKEGWSYLNIYDYIYYKEDGTISCQ